VAAIRIGIEDDLGRAADLARSDGAGLQDVGLSTTGCVEIVSPPGDPVFSSPTVAGLNDATADGR
jgi:hypothetical protein